MLKTIIWDADTQTLNPLPDTGDANARRFRAKEVAETYKYQLYDDRVVFGGMTVMLTGEGVSCTCPDFQERGIKINLPCKHIFAGAFLKGDTRCVTSESVRPTAQPSNKTPVDSLGMGHAEGTSATQLRNSNRVWRNGDRPQNVRVGKHFMLSDFLYSETAVEKGIANFPPFDGMEVESLRGLCTNILDPVVEQFGALSITYGYSAPELHRRIYGSRPLGIHNCVAPGQSTLGAAADILVHSMQDKPREVLLWIKATCVYDRLILYPGSSIVCTAWANRPRRHAKEWVYLPNESKPQYIDLSESLISAVLPPVSPVQQLLF
jgi:hypothetical protein